MAKKASQPTSESTTRFGARRSNASPDGSYHLGRAREPRRPRCVRDRIEAPHSCWHGGLHDGRPTPARTVTTNSTASLRLALLLRRMVFPPPKEHPGRSDTVVEVVPESCPLAVLDVVPDPLLEVLSLRSRPLSLPAPGDPRRDAQPDLAPRGRGLRSPSRKSARSVTQAARAGQRRSRGLHSDRVFVFPTQGGPTRACVISHLRFPRTVPS